MPLRLCLIFTCCVVIWGIRATSDENPNLECSEEFVKEPTLAQGKTWYFAYGSNMAQSRMQSRGMVFKHRIPSFLPNYALKFDKVGVGGYANIHPMSASGVYGILYDVSEEGLTQMDVFEGRPEHYDRHTVQVLLTDPGFTSCIHSHNTSDKFGNINGTVQAITYIAQPDMVKPNLIPNSDYLLNLLGGADLLPEWYIEDIRSKPEHTIQEALEAKYFFVYGTLRPDGDASWSHQFNKDLTGFRANLSGANLYQDSTGYPAIILETSPALDAGGHNISEDIVHGYLLTADDNILAEKLVIADRIEGYPGLYERSTRQVAFATTGKLVTAYVYHRPKASTEHPVPSGDWYDAAARSLRANQRGGYSSDDSSDESSDYNSDDSSLDSNWADAYAKSSTGSSSDGSSLDSNWADEYADLEGDSDSQSDVD